MIKVSRLHEQVRVQLNAIDTNRYTALDAPNLDMFLNKAKDYLQINYKKLAEQSKEFEDILKEREETEERLVKNTVQTSTLFTSFILPNEYLMYLDILPVAKKKVRKVLPVLDKSKDDNKTGEDIECTSFLLNNTFTRKNSMESIYLDTTTQPSWEWRRGSFNFDKNGLNYYHNNEYEVDQIFLSYIKRIPDVANVEDTMNGGYINDSQEAVAKNKNLVIDNLTFFRKMVDIAVFYIRVAKEENYSKSIEEIMFNATTGINPQTN
jgi:hypothetical protein